MKYCELILIASLVSCFTSFVIGSAPDTISFFVTYRDFLPAPCLTGFFPEIYQSAWNTGGIADDTICNKLTPWNSFLTAGTILGHPDFEPDLGNNHYTNQKLCAGEKFPAGSCIFENPGTSVLNTDNNAQPDIIRSIIKTTLATSTSGIPKPQYCSDGENDRCGVLDSTNLCSSCFTSSRKKYFDSWFNDDRRYNKRIGQLIRLDRQTNGLYVFDSDEDVENTEFAGFGSNANTDVADFFDPLFRFKNANTGFTQLASSLADPANAIAWPQTLTDNNLQSGTASIRSFWMTTEIHTTFQYFEDADLTFEFSGDDDFWCFINGKLAIELGGLHPVHTASINLNDPTDIRGSLIREYLELEDGKVYTIDIYHAERHTSASNFKITTNLVGVCNVLLSGTNFIDSRIPTDVSNKILTTNLVTYNPAGGSFELLSAGQQFVNSYIYSKDVQNLKPGFISKWSVTVDGSPEGFAFVVQAYGLTNYPFSGGRHLNFKNLPSSFAVVFDLCVDRDLGSCKVQQVSLNYPDSPEKGNRNSDATRIVYDEIFRPINIDLGGGPSTVEIEVRFLETPDHLEVYIDNSLYLRKVDFSLESILGATGAHVGFTASSGNENRTAAIVIDDWTLSIVEFDANSTIPLNFGVQQQVVADGTPSDGFTIIARDLCGNTVLTGGLSDFISAFYVEELNTTTGTFADGSLTPRIEEALITDNSDGTYSMKLLTTTAAAFSFHVAFGKNCSIIVENQTIAIVNPDETCFSQTITAAVITIPPEITSPPTIDPNANQGDNTLAYVAAGVGSFIGLAGLLAAFLFFRYQRRWIREKRFIEKGEDYKREAEAVFDDKDELTVLGKMFMATQAAISRLRAQRATDPKSAEIASAKNMNDELKEQLRIHAIQSAKKTATGEKSTPAKRTANKKEFEQGIDDGGRDDLNV